MLGCLLFKKFNESCSLLEAARMSSTHLKRNLSLLRLVVNLLKLLSLLSC